MAIEPTRPIGSSHTLLFTGDLVLGTAATGAIPTGAAATRNAVVGSDVGSGTPCGVRFLLADATDPTDKSTILPAYIFDDAQPAGASPHAPAADGVGSAGIWAATDLLMGATWTKNLDVRVTAANATDQALITDINYAGIKVVEDGATSGLGLSTGLPVVIIPMTFGQAFGAWAAVTVRVEITVRHTTVR